MRIGEVVTDKGDRITEHGDRSTDKGGRGVTGGDQGIADAFYTVLSAGIVVLAGLAISAVVLDLAGHEGRAVADRLDSVEGGGAAGLKKGLYALYYTCDPSAEFASSDPDRVPPGDYVAVRTEPAIALDRSTLPPGAPASNGMVIWTGYIVAGSAGDCTFRLESVDGSWLWINGQLIADNHGAHPSKAIDSVTVHLNAGRSPIMVKYFYTTAGNASCRVLVNADGTWSAPACYC